MGNSIPDDYLFDASPLLSEGALNTLTLICFTDAICEKTGELRALHASIISALRDGKKPVEEFERAYSLIENLKKVTANVESACNDLPDPELKLEMQSYARQVDKLLKDTRRLFFQAHLKKLVEESISKACGPESNFFKGPCKNITVSSQCPPLKR